MWSKLKAGMFPKYTLISFKDNDITVFRPPPFSQSFLYSPFMLHTKIILYNIYQSRHLLSVVSVYQRLLTSNFINLGKLTVLRQIFYKDLYFQIWYKNQFIRFACKVVCMYLNTNCVSQKKTYIQATQSGHNC